ncbi:MAG: OmpA family protein, partial [Salinivirgaceae bacterium]|nr:OmpA family protein [Salinivirgaceae bacterium]
IYDIGARMNRLSVGNELVARPGYGWTLFFTNTIGYQATTDKLTEDKYKYSNMYFEFRIRKEFGFRQPRFKYLDLTVFFFKDLNGNGIREKEEPGVENVLVSIDKDYEMSDSLMGTDRRGEFYAMEFLSDMNGMVQYRNIVNGFYNIKFTPMGKTSGNFVTDNSNLRFHLDKSQTIDIPFQEKNKIFGQVMMNRSKLSNLGNIDISNIKVTATDTKGKMFSTLTDKSGKFVIYVPNVEKYTVSINNIFREHFELEQNSFEVQLNGYKQFELTYIFTEKQRRINFAQQLNFDSQSQQVQVVKRTNLGGSVKDGTTFAAIKAVVKIVDESTGNVVSETVTDGRTGAFYISFISGPDYRLDVTSDDYWFYSEKLVGDQLSTFMNINRDISLTPITVGSKLALRNVTFERNDATLNEEAKVELSRMLEVLATNPDIRIQIVGHCDDIEGIDNVKIAEERAKAVMKHLMANGYSNVEHSAEGPFQPLVNETTEEARKLNRRVEAIVISK